MDGLSGSFKVKPETFSSTRICFHHEMLTDLCFSACCLFGSISPRPCPANLSTLWAFCTQSHVRISTHFSLGAVGEGTLAAARDRSQNLSFGSSLPQWDGGGGRGGGRGLLTSSDSESNVLSAHFPSGAGAPSLGPDRVTRSWETSSCELRAGTENNGLDTAFALPLLASVEGLRESFKGKSRPPERLPRLRASPSEITFSGPVDGLHGLSL